MDDHEDSKERLSNCSKTDELPEQSGEEVKIDYQPTPPHRRPDQEIHPRQPMPPLPEGEEVPDKEPSPPVDLD